MLTLLATDGVPGLQICTDGRTWRDVPPIPGALHVNIGDMLHRCVGGWVDAWMGEEAARHFRLGLVQHACRALGDACPLPYRPPRPAPRHSWTNGRYRSTLHRVVNAHGRERHSIAFFFEPDFEARVEALPQVGGRRMGWWVEVQLHPA